MMRIATGIAVLMLTIWPQADAWALQIASPFNIRDNVGPNTVGSIPGDRLVFAASEVTPSGDPTTVSATQGSTTIQVSFRPVRGAENAVQNGT